MLAPDVKKEQNKHLKKLQKDVNTLPFEERLKRLKYMGMLNVKIIGVEEFDYNASAKFSCLISASGETVKPRVRALSWVMRLIEVYY